MGTSGGRWRVGDYLQRAVFRRGKEETPRYPGVPFEAVEKVLSLYVAGLMGETFVIRQADEKRSRAAHTDSRAIYLPSTVAEFPTEKDNFSLYKLMAVHKCAEIQYGTFQDIELLHSFNRQKLLLDIFALVENERVEFLFSAEFKGLRLDMALAERDAWGKRPELDGLGKKAAVLEGITQKLLGDELKPGLRAGLQELCNTGYGLVKDIRKPEMGVADSLALARDLFDRLSALGGRYEGIPNVHFRGEMRIDLVEEALKQVPATESPQGLGGRQGSHGPGGEQSGRRGRLVGTLDGVPRRVIVRQSVSGEGTFGAEYKDNVVWLGVESPEGADEVTLSEEEKEGSFLYPEWNHNLQ